MSVPDVETQVRAAARALGRAGLAHAYGHVSARLDDTHFLVCAAGPMGLIEPGTPGTTVPVRGPLPDGVLGEVRLHQQIYARREDVGAVCRTQPPQVIALSALGRTPLPRHGFGTYFAPTVPMWLGVRLLRDDAGAAAVADTLGHAPAIVLRGNGAVIAAESLIRAVVLSWYLEDAARVELEVLHTRLQDVPVIPLAECRGRAIWSGGIAERMWEYLTAGDPEL